MNSIKFEFEDGTGKQYVVTFSIKERGEAEITQNNQSEVPGEVVDGAPNAEIESQWENLMAYDGTKQKRKDEDVTTDGN